MADLLVWAKDKVILLPIIVVCFIFLTYALRHVPQYEKGSKLNKIICAVSVVVFGILFAVYGKSYHAVQGAALFIVYVYSAITDVRTRELENYVSIIVLLIGFIGMSGMGIVMHGFAAAVMFIVLLICAVISGNKFGGADMKFSAASFFVLGMSKGIVGLVAGLLAGVIGTLIRNKKTKSEDKTLPLLPYLATAFMGAFFIPDSFRIFGIM